ncbi:craniofacial development protein 2-like [Aplysia californica]|uniref:Craniofacial development protein 2-like n=1 Tax=Aplysia californica TaxID=6500 RepID=A0ABM1A668_APLCA|nr:craniofacial development protein 2-like [Aplysia californica]
MGDFNAKVGATRHGDIVLVRPYVLGTRNGRGEKLIECAILNDMIIGNTWYEEQPRRLWTWKSPGDSTGNQIDYIVIKKRYKNGMLNVKTRPGADCYSDHGIYGESEDVAEIIAFYASDAAKLTTGDRNIIDAGLTLPILFNEPKVKDQ